MFTNVIVPLDGSHEATAALPVARTLAALDGGRISLLRVVHRPVGVFASHVNQVREASAYLEEVVRDKLAGFDLPMRRTFALVTWSKRSWTKSTAAHRA